MVTYQRMALTVLLVNLREFKPIENANNKNKLVSKVSYRRIEKVVELAQSGMKPIEIYEYLKRHPI